MLESCRFTLDIDDSDSGTHALGLMRRNRYDVALIDAALSAGMSGFELACQARAECPSTKLILMTKDGGKNVVQAARQFGLRSFLTKPFYVRDVDFALHSEFGLRRPYLLNALVAPPPNRAAGARA
jgi:CheY-like chemotaxis protein